MLQITVPSLTSRLHYVFHLVFKEILGIEYNIVIDNEITIYNKKYILNYNFKSNDTTLFFGASSLLFENEITIQNVNVSHHNNYPTLFQHNNKNAVLPFDPFAAIFYLITRYEEYLPHQRDEHDRFKVQESIAYQHNFVQLPIVNIWIKEVKRILEKTYPTLFFPPQTYQFVPTFDIDYAWSYRNKGMIRTVGAIIKDVSQFRFKTLKNRLEVHFFQKKDPYFTFDAIKQWHSDCGILPIFFFLVGNYGTFDKNTSSSNLEFQALIKDLSQTHEVNIHPSYQSNQSINTVMMEKERLEKIIQKEVTASRQHFLKMTLPETYRNLIKLGITADYTMGYADTIGFRAGIASSFLWYDLEQDKVTKLRISPFQVMDVTLRLYMKYSPEEAILAVKEMIEVIQSVNGLFSTLWHNNSLCEQEGWEGWSKVYQEILRAATE